MQIISKNISKIYRISELVLSDLGSQAKYEIYIAGVLDPQN